MSNETRIGHGGVHHTYGVAEYMFKRASDFGLNPYEMYALGLLHDIGYISVTEGHEAVGAELLSNLGINSNITEAVRYHGYSPEKYKKEFGCTDEDIPKELVLLWIADNSVDGSGKVVGYAARTMDIGKRHGYDSEVYKSTRDTIDWLLKKELRRS